jgi:transcription elongation factor SPT5
VLFHPFVIKEYFIFIDLLLFANSHENREMHIRVERRRNRNSGEYFDIVDDLMFKDGFLHKTFSIKSISTKNVQPSFDELEKFRKPGRYE